MFTQENTPVRHLNRQERNPYTIFIFLFHSTVFQLAVTEEEPPPIPSCTVHCWVVKITGASGMCSCRLRENPDKLGKMPDNYFFTISGLNVGAETLLFAVTPYLVPRMITNLELFYHSAWPPILYYLLFPQQIFTATLLHFGQLIKTTAFQRFCYLNCRKP